MQRKSVSVDSGINNDSDPKMSRGKLNRRDNVSGAYVDRTAVLINRRILSVLAHIYK